MRYKNFLFAVALGLLLPWLLLRTVEPVSRDKQATLEATEKTVSQEVELPVVVQTLVEESVLL